MPQFDVYENPDPRTRRGFPFFVNIQSDLLADAGTVVVIPLASKSAFDRPLSRLNPVFRIRGVDAVLVPQQIAGVSKKSLSRPVASLAQSRDQIVAAIDVLIVGV